MRACRSHDENTDGRRSCPIALDIWDYQKARSYIRGGGIRKRLMAWGLSLFGMAVTTVVVAG